MTKANPKIYNRNFRCMVEVPRAYHFKIEGFPAFIIHRRLHIRAEAPDHFDEQSGWAVSEIETGHAVAFVESGTREDAKAAAIRACNNFGREKFDISVAHNKDWMKAEGIL